VNTKNLNSYLNISGIKLVTQVKNFLKTKIRTFVSSFKVFFLNLTT